jgi:hypothetical protein
MRQETQIKTDLQPLWKRIEQPGLILPVKSNPVPKDLCSVESIAADKRLLRCGRRRKVRDILNVRTGQSGFRPAKLLFPSVAEKPPISRRFEIGSCMPTSFYMFSRHCAIVGILSMRRSTASD